MNGPRGEFRSFSVVMLDGPDFRLLTPEAKLTLFVARLSLGPSGLAVAPAFIPVLAERTGYLLGIQRDAWEALQEAGWTYYDGTVAWIVRALEFESALNQDDPKHRLGFQRHIAALPRTALVGVAVERYAEWWRNAEGVSIDRPAFPVPDSPLTEWKRRYSVGPSKPLERGSVAPAKQEEVEEEEKAEGEAEVEVEDLKAAAAARTHARRQELFQAVAAEASGYVEQFEAEFTAARNPTELIFEINALRQGMHGPGGRAVPLAIIGRAMHDIRVNGEQMTAKRLRVFCGDYMRPGTGTGGDAVLETAERLKAASHAA